MPYAKIVVGLPVEGPFDYLIPDTLIKIAAPGKRARVVFGAKKLIGYIVAISKTTRIKKVKPLLDIIDEEPVLGANLLALTQELSKYYCSSWGEMIESALPPALRKGKKIPRVVARPFKKGAFEPLILVKSDRWEYYFEEIKKALEEDRQALLILPDKSSVFVFKQAIGDRLKVDTATLIRNEPKEAEEWCKVISGAVKIAVGTRSAVFAPLANPGLIILDDEGNSVYKQEQTPHYNAREASLMRAKIEGSKLIFASAAPSLESYYLSRSDTIGNILKAGQDGHPEIKLMDMKREHYRAKSGQPEISRFLLDSVASSLNAKEKVLVFLNRKGFATSASCHNCGRHLQCPRCNTDLLYFYENNTLACPHCNFKMELPKICPQCNSGYIKLKGAGTEKVESELSRVFPQARIKRISASEKIDIDAADIFVATSAILKFKGLDFGLIGVLNIDSALNRLDFRSAEKAYGMLSVLAALTKKKIIIQTSIAGHHLFEALAKNDPEIFYDRELKDRKQLGYPPYKHIILVKLRSRFADKAKNAATLLYEKMSKEDIRGIEVVSLNPSNPAKLRGNFYWQILLKGADCGKAGRFIKLSLKDFRHSGIIVTVDVDPV